MSDCTAQRQVALGEGSVKQSPETQGMRSHRSTQGTTRHRTPLSPPISSAPKGIEKTRPSPALPAFLPKCQLGRLSPGTPRATMGRAGGDNPHHRGAVLLGGKKAQKPHRNRVGAHLLQQPPHVLLLAGAGRNPAPRPRAAFPFL